MAKDEGRQSYTASPEQVEGLQSLEGFGGFEGESVNEAPAVADAVEEDRKGLFAALMIVGPAALAIPTIPREGHAGAGTLVSGSGNEILEWPDVETTVPNAEPARRVVLPGVEGVNIVAVTNNDKIVAVASGDGWDSRRIIVIEDVDGELSVTNEVPVPEMTGLFGDPEVTPDNQVLIPNGDALWRFNPADGTVVPILDGNGQASFTSAESFTDGEGKVNVLAIGQTSGGTNADVLYRICEDDSLVEQNTLPWGNASKISISESKIVMMTSGEGGEGAVSMDFDRTIPESLPDAIANRTVLMEMQEIYDGGGIDTIDHNDFGFYMVGMGDGTVKIISKDGDARSTLPVTGNVYGLNQIGESNEYIGDYATPTDTGMVVINGQSEEVQYIPGNFPGVKAVIPSSPEIDALLDAPVYDEVHVLADPAVYTVTESEEPDTFEVVLDVEALIESEDPAEFSFFTTPFAAFEHTVIIHTGFDDIPLTGYGTACKVRTFVEDGRVKLTAEVLKDGRTGNSSVSLDGGELIYEHPDMDPETPAGENNAQTIELGRVEDFVTQSDDDDAEHDDDDTAELVDDDDTSTVPGGCGSCEYSNGGSDAVAGLSLIAALALTAFRRRVRRGVFGK